MGILEIGRPTFAKQELGSPTSAFPEIGVYTLSLGFCNVGQSGDLAVRLEKRCMGRPHIELE